jgi:hypothetical protein
VRRRREWCATGLEAHEVVNIFHHLDGNPICSSLSIFFKDILFSEKFDRNSRGEILHFSGGKLPSNSSRFAVKLCEICNVLIINML